MAALGQTFDATAVDPSAPRGEVIPPGKYLGQIIRSEMRANKKGTGRYLWLEHEVIDGPHKGAHLFNQLNLDNPSQQAVEIAQRDLSAICHAIGKLQVSDSDELHWKPMLIVVKVRPAQDGYAAHNEVGGYEPASGGQRQTAATQQRAAAQPAQPKPAPTPPAAGGRPWAQHRAA